jgi:hypothetical protein
MEKRRYLEKFRWDVVVEMNRRACEAGKVDHKFSPEGYTQAKSVWEETCSREQTFRETVEICRLCHRLAPFLFFNGSVFTGIARVLCNQVIGDANPTKAFMFKSAVGHYVAGVIGQQALDDIFRRVVGGSSRQS